MIPGQTPSKKNAKQIIRVHGRPMIISSKKHAEWHKESSSYLKRVISISPRGDSDKVTINYMFYCKDARRRDVSNMLESVNDLLVDVGILTDDDWKHLSIGSADAEIDREFPRAEITIKPYRRQNT